jgi:DNA-directed RNA polymerase subunit RPC12/RpoP
MLPALLDEATLEHASLEELDAELLETENEINRLRWAADPVVWAREKLGDVLWSGQVRILEAVRDNRKTAAATCHEVGKSFSAALLAGWWIDTHPHGKAFVVTTAPSNDQVRIILWREIGRTHQRGNLPGRVNQTEWKLPLKPGSEKEETVGIGRKPDDYNAVAFQGVHAPFVLVIVDEANGVRGPLHDALDSLTANDNSKMLYIGNPDDPQGEFFEACKPGSGFKVVHISAFESPNFTGEPLPEEVTCQLIGRTYVEEKRAKWAPSWRWEGNTCVPPPDGKLEDTHPFWQSKVLGQFPVQTAAGSLIALPWIRAAQERELAPGLPNELGLDVGASEAGDPSCLGHRRGQHFRVLYEERQPDTMKTCGKLLQHLGDKRWGASVAKVDYIGVGRGVVDRAREQDLPVYPISVGEASTVYSCRLCKHEWDQSLVPMKRQVSHVVRCPQCGSDQVWTVFANLLSQLWWSVRGLFERGEIDIDAADEQLGEELLTLRWEPNSKGQTVVHYSKTAPSPNRADALLIAFAPVPAAGVFDFQAVGMTSAATW